MIEKIDEFYNQAKGPMGDMGLTKELGEVCDSLKEIAREVDAEIDKHSEGLSKELLQKMCCSIRFQKMANSSQKLAEKFGVSNKPAVKTLLDFLSSTVKQLDIEIGEYGRRLSKEKYFEHLKKLADILDDEDGKKSNNKPGIDDHDMKSVVQNFPHFGLEVDSETKQCKLIPNSAAIFYMLTVVFEYTEEDHSDIEEEINNVLGGWESALGKRLKLIFNRHGLKKAWKEYEEFLYEKGETLGSVAKKITI